jgi:hypothetical protein
VTKDAAEAVKWFRKAAEQGDAKAQYNLGLCCGSGEGTAKDPVEAYMWLSVAATGGQGEALLRRYPISREMSAEQIAAARRLTDAFSPRRDSNATNWSEK